MLRQHSTNQWGFLANLDLSGDPDLVWSGPSDPQRGGGFFLTVTIGEGSFIESTYMCKFHIIGDGKFNPIVGVYIPIIRIPYY